MPEQVRECPALIDLIVGLGEALDVLGPNGAGKSTTISLVLGLLRPSTGREGIPWSTLPTNEVLQDFGDNPAEWLAQGTTEMASPISCSAGCSIWRAKATAPSPNWKIRWPQSEFRPRLLRSCAYLELVRPGGGRHSRGGYGHAPEPARSIIMGHANVQGGLLRQRRELR